MRRPHVPLSVREFKTHDVLKRARNPWNLPFAETSFAKTNFSCVKGISLKLFCIKFYIPFYFNFTIYKQKIIFITCNYDLVKIRFGSFRSVSVSRDTAFLRVLAWICNQTSSNQHLGLYPLHCCSTITPKKKAHSFPQWRNSHPNLKRMWFQWTNHIVFKNIRFSNLQIWVKTDKEQSQLMRYSVMRHSSDGEQK